MSKHHHHPNEGHRSGEPAASRKPLHHDWRFYVAGFFLLIALLAFIFSGNLAWVPAPGPAPGAAAPK
jgi:uncharacterized integral membrane protein